MVDSLNIAVLGSTGMLGKAVVNQAQSLGHAVTPLTRREIDLSNPYHIPTLKWADVVINCAGITYNHPAYVHPRTVMMVNGVAPHMLQAQSNKLVQISTDCVFDGRRGGYTEIDKPNPVDLYGDSKLAGEIYGPTHLTIRTSFIGVESGLLNWFLSLPDTPEIDGWSNAIWTGFTVSMFARYLFILLDEHPDLAGILHVAGDPISKLDLLRIAADVWRKRITIEPVTEPAINRSLKAEYFRHAVEGWGPLPSIRQQLELLKLTQEAESARVD